MAIRSPSIDAGTIRRGALPLSAARREGMADTPAPRQRGWTVYPVRGIGQVD